MKSVWEVRYGCRVSAAIDVRSTQGVGIDRGNIVFVISFSVVG